MPRIPQVEPKVGVPSAPSVRQNIQAQPGAFGAGTAQAFTRAGDVGQKIAEDLQQRRNVIDVQNAYTKAMKQLHEYLHDPENGVYTRPGIMGAGAYAEVRDKLPEIAAGYTKNLSGAQRELFERQWSSSALSALKGVMDFEGRAIKVEQSNALVAIQATEADSMMMNYNRPEAVDLHLQKLLSAIDSQKAVEGWGQDFYEIKKKQVMSKALAATFERFFAVDDVKGAESFLNEHQDKMLESMSSKLRDDLRTKAQAVFVQDEADDIGMKFQDLGDALDYIKENYEGGVRKSITQMVQADFQTQRLVENERQNKQFYTAFESIHQAPNRSAALRIVNQEPDVEVRARLLQVVDSKHPLKQTDEQKEFMKVQRYVAGQNIANGLKKIIDADPELYKKAENVGVVGEEWDS